ncbi:MAG: PEGA domain-containing protein, partial [candidate division KSB1 bacterium]|nr:PEGA domain-containing protein [candidate division KSB1 bacterium]
LRTPTLIYDLPARLHQLTLAKDGYLPRQVEVKIPVEDTASIVVQLSKLPSQPEPTGAIHLTSNPSGAEIYLDGKRLKGQQTPVLIPGLPVGTHYLELRKFHPERETYGYRAKGQIQIRAGHTSNVRMDLELQELCELYVLSDPEGAEIYVNDEESFRGITPLTILLFSGTSYIRLRKEGYQEKAKQVTLIEPRGNVERFTLSQL